MSTQTSPPLSKTRQLLNKVPEVTIYFWIIKCLCTTIGETMSDNLMGRFAVGGANATPGQLQIALYKVAAITVIVLIVLLAIQFRLKRYVPIVYWANIVVISVLGTQITDMFEGQGDVPNHMWAITIVSVTLLGMLARVLHERRQGPGHQSERPRDRWCRARERKLDLSGDEPGHLGDHRIGADCRPECLPRVLR